MSDLAVMNFNIEEMENYTPEQLEKIQSKASETRLKKLESNVIIFADRIKKLEKANEGISIELSKIKEDNVELKKKVFVLRNDQDGKYNDYKKVAKARVYKLVGKESSIEHTLFYDSFIQKLHASVSHILHVSNTGNIMVEDCDLAKGIASKWKPEKKYLRDKYTAYNIKCENGTLTGDKLPAFKQYIEKTNGGRNLEF